nr:ATP-grasp domain-containing protein [Metabacillus flavus]
MENKEETRKHFSAEPYTPAFLLIEEDSKLDMKTSIEKVNYPAMVKCSKSTGSKDVFFCANRNVLLKHVTRLREKDPGETLIIEEYIDGEQYLVEVLVFKGQIRTAAIVKQEITRGKRFIITGYGVLAEVQPGLEEGITKIIQSIVSSLKINNGAFHLELRLTDRGWKLIEINPRISGGAMNKMIQAAFGYSLVKETLKMLLGDSPSLERQTNQFVFTQHVIIENKGVLEKVTGKGRAINTPGVVEVYIKPRKGTFITPPLSMGHRYAYVIAAGDSMEKAESSAKRAANEIVFHIREEGQKNTRIE